MKIKTTSEINRRLRELILDAKDLERIDKREAYCKKKWVAVNDILKNIQDMKELWQEDVLEEKWFNDLINSLSPDNKKEVGKNEYLL